MSKNTTSTKKSRSTAASAETATGVQQDVVVTTSTASDPSGLRAPDGTHSTNTPASSGDAAGDASADLVKPQVNADHTGTIQATAANETPMPEVEASASGTIANASQGDADGAGANAGSGQPEATVADLLRDAYVFSTDELLQWVDLGKQFKRALRDLVEEGLVSEFYIGSTTPVDAFRDLAEKQRLVPTPAGSEHLADLEINAVADQVGEHADRYASMTREDFQRDFPLSYALLSSFTETRTLDNPPLVRVTSRRDGFRRGGIAHSTKPVDYRPGELSPEQLEAILAEPLLTVEVV
ncbi:HI1506-related protein [Rhizobium sp. P007]|uniref:HI1506-related protein n=1 Tax=Rhizobium sp. P007 TaxID=285908 RepID=UPI00115B4399|nr:HI1506-related protein [Rhizobium sp. P007]CAD7055926.1 hypothetical protein RP007_01624 [Rhizobium sp. P007]